MQLYVWDTFLWVIFHEVVPACQKYPRSNVCLTCVFWFRWLCYCHVPQSNDSLPRYETCQVFGRSLLKSIFTVTRRQLLEKFRVEKDKLPPEKRTLILTHFPKYDAHNKHTPGRYIPANVGCCYFDDYNLFCSRVCVCVCARFLSMLEEEIYGENSPIWDAEFTMPANEGAQLGPQTGLYTCANLFRHFVCFYHWAVKFLYKLSLKCKSLLTCMSTIHDAKT